MARLLLIGAGRMGRTHLEALNGLDRLELTAVADPSAEAVATARSLVGAAALYDDAEDAFAHCGADAALIAAPTHLHHRLAAGALEAGLHILCEKPLTLERAGSEELGEQAEAAGLVLQVGFWRRYCPVLVEAKRLLCAGAIGRPIVARLVQWDIESPPLAWCAPELSGGIFVDMGVHEFDQLEWLFERSIVELRAHALALGDPRLEAVGDLDNAQVAVRLEGELAASIELSRTARYADDVRLEVLGDDGALFVDTQPTARVRLGVREGLRTEWESGEDQMGAGVAAELAAFAAAIDARDGSGRPGAKESVRATELAQLARESAAGGDPADCRPWISP